MPRPGLLPALLLAAQWLFFSACSSTRGSGLAKVNAVLEQPEPSLSYPIFADYARVGGTVEATFVVDTTGTVATVEIAREDPKGFEFADSVTATVKRMRFKPAEGDRGKVRQRFKRQFNFESACLPADTACPTDTLTYEYTDSFGNRYRIRTEAGSIRTSFVYDRAGVFLESMYWEKPDSSILLYTRDDSAFALGDSACVPPLFSLEPDSCTRSRAELLAGLRSHEEEFRWITARHFLDVVPFGRQTQVTFKIAPQGKVMRVYLNKNQSRNQAYAQEVIRKVTRMEFRRIKGNQVQSIVFDPMQY